ncbi:GDNF family receptor alpha-1b isoform X1 [Notolabrus celidotus]|uniref:GDNF family receptor alpha-1b isoform X1 n=1 Tax=Notolabrus celidotus TaxID=1203425 RepID=UPI0014900D87|nr:GDNF family receptor alpha-1b isoform X1 [Notolabrus celidotus]
MILITFVVILSFPDSVFTLRGDSNTSPSRSPRLDCVKASEQCLKEYSCSPKYRTMRQCVAGRESNFTAVTGPEAQGECRSAIDAMKQSPLYNCRCRRGMKKEKNCLRIFWSIFQSLQANDLLEYSPYEPINSRLSDIFRLAPIIAAVIEVKLSHLRSKSYKQPLKDHSPHLQALVRSEPASTKENNCLNAAKACNLNDTCKKYRSAYINPCTSRVSASEVCNKRKCHKALRQFFDKVPTKYSYGMLFCSCPAGDQTACAERRRQTIVPICSYEDKDKPNCLSLQNTCKTNYICRSRLADFISACQPEARSISGCLRENYADCLLSYSGLIGTVMTPNYVRSLGISLSPWCDCSSSGNSKPDCERFAEFFTSNRCLRNAIQAFGNGTDVGVWQPQPPIQPTVLEPGITRRGKDGTSNVLDSLTDMTKLDLHGESSYHICGTLQAQKLVSNVTVDTSLCVNHQLDESMDSNAIARSSALKLTCLPPSSILALAFALTPMVSSLEGFQLL